MEWRPIETAPKDGTEVLLWTVYANAIVASYYSLGVGIGWFAGDHELREYPSHWMPLPDPPAARANRIEAPVPVTEGVEHG